MIATAVILMFQSRHRESCQLADHGGPVLMTQRERFQSRHRESCQLALVLLLLLMVLVLLVFQSRHRESCQLANFRSRAKGEFTDERFNRAIANPAS